MADLTIPDAVANAVAAMLELSTGHQLRRRAEASCMKWLQSPELASELTEDMGISPADIQIVYERCALVFDHEVLGRPFVETRLGLYVLDPTGVCFRGLQQVGHYRLITLPDGTDKDDYFVLDRQRHL